jgi:CTP-dependent riboflavin kinase
VRLTGIIFSDLGQAASFMALDRVQASLKQCLGFSPFPATLNVRPKAAEDLETWRRVQREFAAIPLPPIDGGFCSAKIFRARVSGAGSELEAAVLVPEVKDYPLDKIEIVAPVRVKDRFRVGDGDALTLEFIR